MEKKYVTTDGKIAASTAFGECMSDSQHDHYILYEQAQQEIKRLEAELVELKSRQVSKDRILEIIRSWQMFWTNQYQYDERDFRNYFRRAFGVDANMKHHLANTIADILNGHKPDGYLVERVNEIDKKYGSRFQLSEDFSLLKNAETEITKMREQLRIAKDALEFLKNDLDLIAVTPIEKCKNTLAEIEGMK